MRCFKIAIAILKQRAKRGRRLRRLRSRSYSPRKPKACRAAAGGIANNCIVCNSGQYITAFPRIFLLNFAEQKTPPGVLRLGQRFEKFIRPVRSILLFPRHLRLSFLHLSAAHRQMRRDRKEQVYFQFPV